MPVAAEGFRRVRIDYPSVGPVFEYQTVFDARGALYNRANRLFPEARAEEARRLLAHLAPRPYGPWLDVSAGGGYLSQRTAAEGGDPARFGCDGSLHFLSSNGAVRGASVARAEELPFPEGSFAGAACLAALHHSEEPGRVASELLRVARPEGRVAIGDVAAGSRAAEFLNGFVHRYTEAGHRGRFYEPSVLESLLRNAGGVDLRSERAEIAWAFESAGDAERFCRDLFGLVLETPREAIRSALDALGAVRRSRTSFRLPWTMLYVSACRA